MTLIELQNILGGSIDKLVNANSIRERAEAKENAEYITKVAKQMVNNADVILRTDKMCGVNSRINAIVGTNDAS